MPGELHSMGLQRVGHDGATEHQQQSHMLESQPLGFQNIHGDTVFTEVVKVK